MEGDGASYDHRYPVPVRLLRGGSAAFAVASCTSRDPARFARTRLKVVFPKPPALHGTVRMGISEGSWP